MMWFELGHRTVWYIHEYECFEVVYTGHRMLEAVGPGQNIYAEHLHYTVP
jgi:hypothetical protein